MTRDCRSLGGTGGENGERTDHENEPAAFMSCRAKPGDRLGAIAEAGRPSPCARRSKDTCRSCGPGAVQGASSTCAAEVAAIHATWAEYPDGYAAAVTPVTSAQV